MTMRYVTVGVGLGALVLFAGCPNWSNVNNQNGRPYAETPRVEQLLTALNDNARKAPALECTALDMDCKQDGQSVALRGKMVMQKPHNFYLRGDAMGQPRVQIGSNDQEFWYWISEVKPTPYLFHCSYEDYKNNNVKNMPLPFHPEWLVDAMGIAPYVKAPSEYKLHVRDKTFELEEQTTLPTGQPVRKVTVLSKTQTSSGKPQVLAYQLHDANGKLICAAHVKAVQQDRDTGAVVPRQVQLVWPAEKIELMLRLDDVRVLRDIDPNRAGVLFNRRALANLQGYDLARGPDPVGGQLQPAGGFQR